MATQRKFSYKILKYLSGTKIEVNDKSNFFPTFVNGKWRGPRFSLRRQADLRKACLLHDVDPVVTLGLPPLKEKKALRSKPPKGHKEQRDYLERKEKVEKALQDMPKKITEWKDNKLKETIKNKPSLPF